MQFPIARAVRPVRAPSRARATLSRVLIVAGLATWLGCGGGGPEIVLPADPKAASQTTLESVFTQITGQEATVKPGSGRAEELAGQHKLIGGELAERAAAAVRTRIADIPRVDGKLPLGPLQKELEAAKAIARYDSAVHEALARELEPELEGTRRELARRERELGELGDDALLERLKLLSGLASLAGKGSSEFDAFTAQREELLGNVSKEAEKAIRDEDYEKAQGLLGIVQEVDPSDETARKKKCEVDGKVLLKQFSQALETGSATRSMSMLADFSEKDCFAEIKSALQDSAAPMAEAFAALGAEATAAQNLGLAYHRYRDAQTISQLLLGRPATLPGVESFLGQLDGAYEKAFAAGEYGVALGLLDVRTELGTTTPQMRQQARMTRDEINRRAVRGLTAYPFEDPKHAAAKVGDAVASKVVQHIFSTIPSDVRIVEREQLERILDECKRNGNCNALTSADFIVQGTINDAKVETTEKTGRETRRVVTGKQSIPNPAHAAWLALKERERKKQPEPAATILQDITEDVEFDVTSVRKVGIISVSYRVVEASSGRVVFTDSMQDRQEFQDEGRQGVQLGDFKQETDFVELPPDIEILSGDKGLADKISDGIGQKLVEFLQNPEDQYEQEASRAVEEGDFAGAARKIAYAISLREAKSKDVGRLKELLRSYAMQSPRY
jgi:curli biogenesis system outer membrane secretion channel CsgG